MIGLRLTALLFLLVLNAVVPGFLVVRRLGWRPLETLCAAVGASLVLLYLWTFGLYLAGVSLKWCVLVSVASAAALFRVGGDLRRLFAVGSVRRVVVRFAGLLAWTLLFVGVVRNFGGGGWGGDWLEHFHRCLYFLYPLPADTALNNMYHVTARPPFMNVLGAYFLAHVGDDFESFQMVFAFLNALPFLACALLLGRLWERGGRSLGVLAALFALNPLFVENVTYTWTKLLSAFFVILAVHFYLAARARGGTARELAWPSAVAAALLVHYSAGPFAIFIAGHYLATLARREPPRTWPRRLAPAVPGLLLLGTWLAWALLSFGLTQTLTSNTSVNDSRGLSASGNAAKAVHNVVDTLVPHPFRSLPKGSLLPQGRAGHVRDYAFLIFQTNAIVAVGSVGGVLAVVLLARRLRRRPWSGGTAFWVGFVPFVLVAGVATHGGRDHFGVAHVTLQPLVLLGVTLLAAGWRSLGVARWAAIAGCVVDFGFGIALHHELESWENTAEHQVFDDDARVGPQGLEWRREDGLSKAVWHSWQSKHAFDMLERERERARMLPPDRAQRLIAALDPELRRLEHIDATRWAGWYSRHGRALTFVGDRLAAVALLVRLLIAVMLVWWLRLLSRAAGS